MIIQSCHKCGIVSEMAKGRNMCRPCWNKKQYEWRQANKEQWSALKSKYQKKKRKNKEWADQQRLRARLYWSNLRNAALNIYGRKCACCGETEDKFLTLDHMENNGAQHRRELKTRGVMVWKWLRDNNYPKQFQILCMNCNLGKHLNGGICPHNKMAIAI